MSGGLPVLLDDGARRYVWGASGLAYTVDKSSGTVTTYHTDGLGSVRALTDSTGNVVQTYGSDAWGVPLSGQTLGSSSQPMKYTGEQVDSTGLVYLRARMYDPMGGRFLQRDSFGGYPGRPSSLNPFSYALNNPTNLTDPRGDNPLLVACAGGAVLSVATDVGMDWLSGTKVTESQALRSATTGCVFGLAGFGAGKAVGAIASKALTAMARDAAEGVEGRGDDSSYGRRKVTRSRFRVALQRGLPTTARGLFTKRAVLPATPTWSGSWTRLPGTRRATWSTNNALGQPLDAAGGIASRATMHIPLGDAGGMPGYNNWLEQLLR